MGIAQVDAQSESATSVRVAYRMRTPGTVVLADLWYPGWKAYVNGEESAILIADHAFRGVDVPKGEGVIEFVYDPWSFKAGVILLIAAVATLTAWNWYERRKQKRTREIP